MNGWRGVYLFVEGQDDVLFVERILKPRLETHFEFVAIIAYASIRQATLAQQARAIQKSGAHLWVIADYDNAPCLTARRTEVVQRFEAAIAIPQVLLAPPKSRRGTAQASPNLPSFGYNCPATSRASRRSVSIACSHAR
ncbi:MAG: hypothetical protein RQ971_00650 [Armatimonadota bacterium]|nr:hypothetical protein [Armatimonadota bacterium]